MWLYYFHFSESLDQLTRTQMCTILGMVSPLRQQETSLLDLSTHDLVFVSNKITKLYLPSQVLFLHSEKKLTMLSPAIWKSSLENDDCTYIYLRPSLALTLNIEHKYLYLRPSLATFNHMKIFFWEWRLYIYLRPSLALTINIWTLTLSHFINNFVSCFHPTPSIEYSSEYSGQRWIDTTLFDWYIWFGLLHLHNAI